MIASAFFVLPVIIPVALTATAQALFDRVFFFHFDTITRAAHSAHLVGVINLATFVYKHGIKVELRRAPGCRARGGLLIPIHEPNNKVDNANGIKND